jgi:hypothetical protein
VVFYDDYFRRPGAVVERLGGLLGPAPEGIGEAGTQSLIDRGLRHHESGLADTLRDEAIAPAARAAYGWLRAIGSAPGVRATGDLPAWATPPVSAVAGRL